jgi:hypothetical protein
VLHTGENNQYTYYVQVVPVIRQYASGERVKYVELKHAPR